MNVKAGGNFCTTQPSICTGLTDVGHPTRLPQGLRQFNLRPGGSNFYLPLHARLIRPHRRHFRRCISQVLKVRCRLRFVPTRPQMSRLASARRDSGLLELVWAPTVVAQGASSVVQATNAALIAEVGTGRATAGRQGTTDVVLAAAEVNKQLVLAHSTRVREAVSVAIDTLNELRMTTTQADQIRALFEKVTEDNGARLQVEPVN